MTYGKVFSKLYRGSMVGAGLAVYALMPYIITEGMPDRRHGGYIELNPTLLATIFGTTPDVMEKAIEFLCSPDKETSTPGDDGRRLVKLGPFSYRIVNYAYYKGIRDEEDRREQNRVNQETFRSRAAIREQEKLLRKAKGNPLPGAVALDRAINSGNEDAAGHLEDHPPHRDGVQTGDVSDEEKLKHLLQPKSAEDM